MKIIEQNKFSESVISLRYVLELNENTITSYNLLCHMLRAKTEAFEDKRKISLELNKNYGMRMSINLSSYGKLLCLQYRFQYIRSDWIDDDNYLDRIIDVMNQFLFHSVLTEENLLEAKYLLHNRLLMQRDDPFYMAMITSFGIIQEKQALSIPVQGYLEKIDEVTLDDIEELHTFIQSLHPHVYVCGHIDEKVKNYLASISSQNEILSNYSILKGCSYIEKRITRKIEQTCLSKVYKTNVEPSSKEYDALLLMNSILGQSPVNLLFEEVREKHSYCYSIGSNIVRFDGALYIYAGCKKENVDKILSLIDVQIQRLIDMEYEDDLLEIAKKDWMDGLTAGLDNQIAYIERSFISSILCQHRTLQQRMNAIQQVTKEDISEVAKKLKAVSLAVVQEDE